MKNEAGGLIGNSTASPGTFIVNGTASTTFAGQIVNGGIGAGTGVTSLVKSGTSTLTLGVFSVNNPDAMGRAEAAVLRKRRRPALVIWGGTDQYIPAYVAYEQDQAFPGASVNVLDSGHWPFVDNVAKVDRLVIPFWRRNVARPATGRRHR